MIYSRCSFIDLSMNFLSITDKWLTQNRSVWYYFMEFAERSTFNQISQIHTELQPTVPICWIWTLWWLTNYLVANKIIILFVSKQTRHAHPPINESVSICELKHV